MSLLPYLEQVAERRCLSAEQAREAMHVILGGHASQPQLAAFLMAMRMKGETVEELVGFARAMREMAAPVEHGIVGETLPDTCGTGGDGAGAFNISTIAAFVVAGAGVRVAKHGNRSISKPGRWERRPAGVHGDRDCAASRRIGARDPRSGHWFSL